jgi:hypothetical protein
VTAEVDTRDQIVGSYDTVSGNRVDWICGHLEGWNGMEWNRGTLYCVPGFHLTVLFHPPLAVPEPVFPVVSWRELE